LSRVNSVQDATTVRAGDDDELIGSAKPVAGRLQVVHCPGSETFDEVVTLEQGAKPLLVGRGAHPGLLLADPRLSRLHFRIVWDAAQRGFRLGDAGSSNGTFVNGTRVDTHLLNHSDVIRCGDTLLVFEADTPMATLHSSAQRFADARVSVVIHGETGVGKEVLARFIHERSGSSGEFVAVNCATLSRDLVAAELFGHVRGAFSGATQQREGLFVHANGGTLLLDEVGDLPLDVQPALLRVLEERAVRPLGSDQTRPVDVHVLAATHVDLDQAVESGAFRQDLLARLRQARLEIPPLRERRSDILALLGEMIGEAVAPPSFSVNAMEALLLWDYPHNVRELR
jgi:transcriptional regulator of acetoin/glycerol metabolism